MPASKQGRRSIIYTLPVLFLGSFVFFSCATNSFAKVDGAVGREDYSGGVLLLEEDKSSNYSNRDAILYYLDKGMLTHYAAQYDDSSRLLETGERAIEEAFTKSVTREIGTYLLNDNTREYAGEDYEDMYINAFNALNYYHRGEIEGALVEVRRMNNKAQYLSGKYGVELSNLQKRAMENLSVVPPNEDSAPVTFTDSALARYLGMLFYRSSGRHDDARIDRNQLLAVFANAPRIYPHPVPSSIKEDLEIPRGMARLNVLAFSGLSPVKEEEVLRVLIPNRGWIKIAIPVMKSRPSEVGRIEAVLDDGQRFHLELLEDIDAVARDTFEERKQVIYLKTVFRAVAKGAMSVIAGDDRIGESGGWGIFGLLTQAYIEVSEQADLRISRYFPGRAWAGGINLAPGTYSFQVNYYGHSGKLLVSRRYEDITVRANALNLEEAICLR